MNRRLIADIPPTKKSSLFFWSFFGRDTMSSMVAQGFSCTHQPWRSSQSTPHFLLFVCFFYLLLFNSLVVMSFSPAEGCIWSPDAPCWHQVWCMICYSAVYVINFLKPQWTQRAILSDISVFIVGTHCVRSVQRFPFCSHGNFGPCLKPQWLAADGWARHGSTFKISHISPIHYWLLGQPSIFIRSSEI